jgi:hypothetical protein
MTFFRTGSALLPSRRLWLPTEVILHTDRQRLNCKTYLHTSSCCSDWPTLLPTPSQYSRTADGFYTHICDYLLTHRRQCQGKTSPLLLPSKYQSRCIQLHNLAPKKTTRVRFLDIGDLLGSDLEHCDTLTHSHTKHTPVSLVSTTRKKLTRPVIYPYYLSADTLAVAQAGRPLLAQLTRAQQPDGRLLIRFNY